MIDELLGLDREYIIKASKDYGKRIRKKVSLDILRLTYKLEEDIKELKMVKKTQERDYPYIGVTVEELEEFQAYLVKMITIFRAEP